MFKRIYNIIFVIAFLTVLCVPLLFADFTSGEISENENRFLADFPALTIDGQFNERFTAECEDWFRDHMGLRQELIKVNATLQYKVFNRFISTSNYHIGANGDVNYATAAMIQDYAHLNLRSEASVANIGQSYQAISDWLENQGIQFYYVQCYDKHSIYPEQFMDTINQFGNTSKTDQIIHYLQTNTTVDTISLKEILLSSKETYEVYSNWGDPSHWTDRGAYLGYCTIMDRINGRNLDRYPVLRESDYNITMEDRAIQRNWIYYEHDILEVFSIKEPHAEKQDVSVMGEWASDERHSVWKNENVDNDTKLLLMCDSYVNNFIIDDFAESFSEVWLIWGDYTSQLPDVIALYQPDIVIYECAERVDRSGSIYNLAGALETAS